MQPQFVILKISSLLAISALATDICIAQEKDLPEELPSRAPRIAALTTRQFDEWLLPQLIAVDRERQQPKADLEILTERFKPFNQAVLSRLENGQIVTQSTVLTLVQFREFLEQNQIEKLSVLPKPNSTYAQTQQLIRSLLEKVEDNPSLAPKLHQRLARLLERTGDDKGAIGEYEKALPVLDKNRLDADVERVSTLVAAADVAAKMQDLPKADDYYLQAYSYPWYTVRSGEHFRSLIRLSIQAGLGLIEVRKGNLKLLKEIYVVPALNKRLMLPLQKAIKEAEKK